MKTNTYNQVCRIAVTNNFNCTPKEFQQVDGFTQVYPTTYFFINSNIKTPKLIDINKYNYKAVITVNPDITVNPKLINKLYAIKNKISFVRVKWIPYNQEIQNLIKKLSHDGFKVVITVMRFNSDITLTKYTNKEYYNWKNTRYRLNDKQFLIVKRFADSLKNVFICDRKQIGCLGCGLCAELNGQKGKEIVSLNLSSSGVCKFRCVDCYARPLQHFIISCGKNPINFNVIEANKKQAGKTGHIKENMAKLK